MGKHTGKRVCELSFLQCEHGPKTRICRCGKKRKVKGKGYTNLVNHVQSNNPEQYSKASNEARVLTAQQTTTENSTISRQSESFVFIPKTTRVNGWPQYITLSLKPFDSCKNEDKVRQTRYRKMENETFMKSIELVSKRLAAKKRMHCRASLR